MSCLFQVLVSVIWFFLVDLLTLELFLKCSYFGLKIEARCSYTIVIIKKGVFTFIPSLQQYLHMCTNKTVEPFHPTHQKLSGP